MLMKRALKAFYAKQNKKYVANIFIYSLVSLFAQLIPLLCLLPTLE
jgi:uncharacterized membrane protein